MPSYPGISSEAFRHPLDREAEQALRSLPGFDLLARKFLEVAVDRPQYLYHMGNSIQVGPRQYASLYHPFRDCLRDLDIYPEPALFVSQSYEVNAFTIGQEQPTIVLTTALLELLGEAELRVVIAHELGHLKCGHSTLTQMAVWAISAASVVGQMTMGISNILVSNALVMAFYEWKRKAELSADRAALLVADDLDQVLLTMLKVAGGSPKHLHELSLDEFKKQARDYQLLDADAMNQAYKFFLYNNLPQGIYSSHPFPIERASYLQEWAKSGDYQAIRRGDYRRDPAAGAVNVNPQPSREADRPTEADRLRRQIENLQRELDRLRTAGS
ncbi:MAG: M48 family peptidase [Oscillatoriales cyanobacterium]|nr:MAG: M48 family peptidase [Oscillatoriales cyanobacterium]